MKTVSWDNAYLKQISSFSLCNHWTSNDKCHCSINVVQACYTIWVYKFWNWTLSSHFDKNNYKFELFLTQIWCSQRVSNKQISSFGIIYWTSNDKWAIPDNIRSPYRGYWNSRLFFTLDHLVPAFPPIEGAGIPDFFFYMTTPGIPDFFTLDHLFQTFLLMST